LGEVIKDSAALCTVHAESGGELDYALQFYADGAAVFGIEE
jgi:hypothetical protein